MKKEAFFNRFVSLMKKFSASKKRNGTFKFDWEGGLSDIKGKYTSVELAHKSLEWR